MRRLEWHVVVLGGGLKGACRNGVMSLSRQKLPAGLVAVWKTLLARSDLSAAVYPGRRPLMRVLLLRMGGVRMFSLNFFVQI
jgi:hypothetical protein